MSKKTFLTLILSFICLTSFGQISTTANIKIRQIPNHCYAKETGIEKVDDHTMVVYSTIILDTYTYQSNFYLLREGENIASSVELNNDMEVFDSYVLGDYLYFCGRRGSITNSYGYIAKAHIPTFFNNGSFEVVSLANEDIYSPTRLVAYKNSLNQVNIACLADNKLIQYNDITNQCIIDSMTVYGYEEDFRDIIVCGDSIFIAGNVFNSSQTFCGWNLRSFDKNNISNTPSLLPLMCNYSCRISNVRLAKYESSNVLFMVTDPIVNNSGNGALSIFLIENGNIPIRYDINSPNEYTYLWDATFSADGDHKNLSILTYNGDFSSSVYYYDFSTTPPQVKVYKPQFQNMLTSIESYKDNYVISVGVEDLSGRLTLWDRNVLFDGPSNCDISLYKNITTNGVQNSFPIHSSIFFFLAAPWHREIGKVLNKEIFTICE